MSTSEHPAFSSLPLDKAGPHGNAWGLWGPDDQIGTLNHLTPDVVATAAREEIRTGQRVSLNWSMTGPSHPKLGRKGLDVNLINKEPVKVAHDDEWSFNSQISSQWDGFRHYGYQKEKVYYMGHSAEEFQTSTVNGIHHIAKQGIAGRGILIDWYRWASTQPNASPPIDAFTPHAISFTSLLEAAASQGLGPDDFRRGDILFIRSGYIAQYEGLEPEKQDTLAERYRTQKPENIGVEPSEPLLRFLWEKGIAAVAGDSRSFEVWPCTRPEWHLHEWLLAGWGMPIGELFDLEEVSAMCARLGRYKFFVSSEVLNVPGGVASPPNALAFF
ncbi:hypothetical protein P170DRAFT_431496 [Aspergillus steynii IBT 23096]|uniref:Cyclase n=1 Tax=Aspergillus steynii IBT 23096 TaxID=1392250 RepID=A0A2I2GLD4_9EURO|nr:uncharacterized protein P170DRAFT_431496 [Aspergillus steynii IBT 23096]PLB53677.1 hypothetical protein P170DRAFT_431496 [Aspergillus steynii IBT 23096]